MGLYVVISTNTGRPNGAENVSERHYAYLKARQEEGSLIASGPFGDRSGALTVYFAPSLERAREMAAADPYHASGLRSFEVRAWDLARYCAWLTKPGGIDGFLKPVGSPNRPG